MLSNVRYTVVGISPDSVSPVLKQDLTITFDTNHPDLDIKDYKVFV